MPADNSDKKVQPLLDLASEEVMSLSDEEIRARAAEEGIDIKAQGAAFRQVLQQNIKQLKMARLHRARDALAAEKAAAYDIVPNSLSIAQVRARISEFLDRGLLDASSRLTLAFRSGKEMDEDDLRTLLADCEELAKRQEGEDE